MRFAPKNMCCCLAEDLALRSACCPVGDQWGRNPHNTASCRFRPRKTCGHCELGMPVSGKEREGRVPARWEDPSDESPAFGRAARWGSPSSLLNALACLLIPKCKAWLPHPLPKCLCWMSAWGEGKSLGSIVFFPSWWGYQSQNGSLMTFTTEKVPGCEAPGQAHPAAHSLLPPSSLHTHGLPSRNCMVVRYYENKNVNCFLL